MLDKLKKLAQAVRHQRQIRELVSTQLSLLEGESLFALGGLSDEEEKYLGSLVSEHLCEPGNEAARGPIVEFGTLFGLTTRLLAAAAGGDRAVITVDNFSWNPLGLTAALHEQFARKVLRSEISSGAVSLYVGDSVAFRRSYGGPVPALVFFDADHSYEAVRDEIVWARQLGVPLICGHDYGNTRFGVTRAVDEAFPEGVDVHGMVWSAQRRRPT